MDKHLSHQTIPLLFYHSQFFLPVFFYFSLDKLSGQMTLEFVSVAKKKGIPIHPVSENEAQLTAAIEELTRNKTILMIAHRLKTVRHTDQIFVISDRAIKEQGNHQSLMKSGGIYRSFVSERKEAVSWKL